MNITKILRKAFFKSPPVAASKELTPMFFKLLSLSLLVSSLLHFSSKLPLNFNYFTPMVYMYAPLETQEAATGGVL